MNRCFFRRSARFLFVFSLFLSFSLFAQTPTGQISGTVVDDSGSVLPGVTVTVRNQQTGLTRNAVTGAEGLYVIPLLPSGTYDVTGELSGFQTSKRSNVVVSVGSDITVRLQMRVGVQETITVSADAPVSIESHWWSVSEDLGNGKPTRRRTLLLHKVST